MIVLGGERKRASFGLKHTCRLWFSCEWPRLAICQTGSVCQVRRGGRIDFLLFVRLVSRKSFDFELFGNVEKCVQLLLRHVHLAVVHEVEDKLEVAELDTWWEQSSVVKNVSSVCKMS